MRPQRSKIVFVQYMNPAGYPPLEHASRILADQGWRVVFLSGAVDKADVRRFPPHDRIEAREFPSYGAGILQHINYVAFTLWAALWCLWHRPDWIYASDATSCPAALVMRALSGSRIVYHEHDATSFDGDVSIALGLVGAARAQIAATADLCVIPQQQRLEHFVSTARRAGPTVCVHNYPRQSEAERAPSGALPHQATFYYHGNLSGVMLPTTILDALANLGDRAYRLRIVGYEAFGHAGYMDHFLQHADSLGIRDRIDYVGPLSRREMLAVTETCDVGLVPILPDARNLNIRHLAGASNKPFDYLARGLFLVVPDAEDWKDMFVQRGLAIAGTSSEPFSLTSAFLWCLDHLDDIRATRSARQRQILQAWNYEAAFEPVAAFLRSGPAGNAFNRRAAA